MESFTIFIEDFMPMFMFASLAVLLFTGYPVAFILGGLAFVFGIIGFFFDMFALIEFFNFVPRIWGQAAENLVLVAVPTFVFMGIMMERSGIANDLLYCCQVLLKRVPGGLALSVTIMGTILAAMTGIIGASVTMMTALALPTMLRQRYSHQLATGVIAASGTLGILIPPSIMLIIMADLLSISVGNLFMAALVPGLCLAVLYLLYVTTASGLKPSIAPPLPAEMLYVPRKEMPGLLARSFFPPVFLIGLIKSSILLGWATPSEAGAVGAAGATFLAIVNRRLGWETLKGVCHSAGLAPTSSRSTKSGSITDNIISQWTTSPGNTLARSSAKRRYRRSLPQRTPRPSRERCSTRTTREFCIAISNPRTSWCKKAKEKRHRMNKRASIPPSSILLRPFT